MLPPEAPVEGPSRLFQFFGLQVFLGLLAHHSSLSLCLHTAVFPIPSPRLHMALSCLGLSPPYDDTSHIELGPHSYDPYGRK